MSSFTRQQLERWLSKIDVKGSVLDVGGSQNPIKGRTKSWDVNEYKILDLEQPHEVKQKPDIKLDINKNYYIHPDDWEFNKKKIKNNNTIYDKYHQYLDNIFCIEVSEYWYNPYEALNNIWLLLKRGGLLYVSFHFIYPQHPPMRLDYLRYTPAGVERLLKEAGFEIMEHIPRRTQHAVLSEIWSAEQMRGWKVFDNTIIGSLIKARKV